MEDMRFFFAVVLFFALVLAIITFNPFGMGAAILASLGNLIKAFIESPFFLLVIMSVGIALMIGSIFK